VVPAAIELIDADSLRAVEAYASDVGAGFSRSDANALLIIESDGTPAAVAEEIDRVDRACRDAAAIDVVRAADDAAREALWETRRQVSLALRATGLHKINHDVVVPRGRVPELFAVIAELKARFGLRVAAFGHAGDGNIHVNLMINPGDAGERARAKEAEGLLFQRVVALEGSISGEHGIGFAKAAYLGLELSPEEIALMQRVKAAFDPRGILNPGKIFSAE
jgi:FAD/FMN-containing dehydrogenase